MVSDLLGLNQGISVDKLIKDNPTMIKLFEKQSNQEVIKEV